MINQRTIPRTIIIYVVVLTISELITSFHSQIGGILMHSLLILCLLGYSSVIKDKEFSNIFKVLTLPPLIRIIWASMPHMLIKDMYWLLVIYLILFLASYLLIRNQGKDLQWAGIVFNKPPVQLTIVLMGVVFGTIEYFILSPGPLFHPLISALVIGAPLVPPVAFIMFLSFVEELIFRGIIQNNAMKLIGEIKAVIFVSVIFAIMHIVWHSPSDLVFVLGVSLFYGYAFLKTKSIIGVSLSHGIANIFLFLIIPFM